MLVTCSGDIPPYSFLALLELQYRVIGAVDALALTGCFCDVFINPTNPPTLFSFAVPLDDPSSTPNAVKLDAESVASFFGKKLWTRAAKDAIDLLCLATFGCQSSQISMLFMLYAVNSCGGIRALIDVNGGAQESRVIGGTQQVSEALANAIRVRGGENVKIELGCRVVGVRARNRGTDHPVMVTLQDGRRFATR